MKLATALDEYRLFCRAENLSDTTLRWYDQKLAVFQTYLTAEGVETVGELRAALVHRFTEHLKSTPA